MKNLKVCVFCLISILLININRIYAQTLQSNPKHPPLGWTTNNPFRTDVFIENFGQFNKWVKHNLPILYAVNNSDKIFFTKQGVIFKLIKLDSLSEEEREHQEHNNKDRDKDKDKDKEENIFYVAMNWEGCNPNAEIKVNEASEGYYTFGEKGYENMKAKGFKKLLYKDIYPNIDVEYTIPDKGGIKYKVILHPGANPSLIKMLYTGAIEEIKKDKDGSIIIETPAGAITDHPPKTYYENSKQVINSSFEINNNTISFQLQTSNSQLPTIIIDPWTTTPTSMTINNTALDIDYDKYDNVFFSGGTEPFKLSKYSNTGAFLWTFTYPNDWANISGYYFYSKFCVLTTSGTTFIGEGFASTNPGSRIMKIGNNGLLNYTSPYFGQNNEIWEMFYNNCSKQIIAFGGGTIYNDNIKVIADTNLSNSTSNCFNGVLTPYNDIASVKMDDNGDFYALITSTLDMTTEGLLQKSLYTTNYSPPCAFSVQTNIQLQEGGTGLQGVSGSVISVRANCLALNSNYVFTYDGMTLMAWNKTNGSSLGSIIVNNSYSQGYYRTHEGIDVDDCNTVYVSGTNKVHVFTFTGNSFTTLTPITTNILGEVRDIKLNRTNGKLYVCGAGFVTEAIAPIPCLITPIVLTVTNDSCLGNACVTATGGVAPYSYQWSNGSTDSCITGVSTGVYTITVTDNSCSLNSQTDTVLINSSIQAAVTPSNPVICLGDTVTLVASSPNFGITYHWNNGINTNSIIVSPTITTTYTVIVSNSSCSNTVSVIVTVNSSNLTVNASICQSQSYQVGIHNYTLTGTYKDTLTNYLGCDSIITTNLTVIPIQQTTLNPVICQGETYYLDNHPYTTTGTYIDSLTTALGCDSILTINLITVTPPIINLGEDTTLCQGQTIILNATYQHASYLWQDNNTNPTYIVSHNGIYWVKVSIDSNCFTSDTIKISFQDCSIPDIYIPNSFTPNGDGLNDIFKIKTIAEFSKFNLYIYDRWGELLFESADKNYGWDGTYKGKPVPIGVYVYLLDVTIKDTIIEKMLSGSVTVIR